jgi:hypothetical protein
VSGAGEILANLVNINRRIAEFLIYGISASVVFFGLKAVGIAERFGTLALIGLITIIGVGGFSLPFHIQFGLSDSPSQWLALYGMVMYALWTFYSVPQVVKGLGSDHRGAARVILIGLGINGILTLIVALIALGISTRVTEIAIIGIAERMGAWSGIIGSLLILFALVTSYWSVSLALTDILRERTRLSKKISWLLATLPSLLILWIDKWQFLEWLRLAAGTTALVVALITIPMYLQARLTGSVSNPDWTLGRWGRPAMLAFALFSLILMAVGSIISV